MGGNGAACVRGTESIDGRWWANKSRGQPMSAKEKSKADVLVAARRPIGVLPNDISDYFGYEYITGAEIAVLRSVIGRPSPWRDTTTKVRAFVRVREERVLFCCLCMC